MNEVHWKRLTDRLQEGRMQQVGLYIIVSGFVLSIRGFTGSDMWLVTGCVGWHSSSPPEKDEYYRWKYDSLAKIKQCFGRTCSLHFMVVYPEDEGSTFPQSSFISQRRQSYLYS
jgi:hypothetical protein